MTETETELLLKALGEPLRRAARWAVDHLVALLAAGTTLAVVLKLLAVSRFDATTGFALVARTGVLQVGLGTLVLLLPPVVTVVFAVLAALSVHLTLRLPRQLSNDHADRVISYVAATRAIYVGLAAGAVGALMFVLVPTFYGGLGLAIVPMLVILFRRNSPLLASATGVDERGWWDRRFRFAIALSGITTIPMGALAVGFMLMTLFNDRMWLPAEVVSPPGEHQWVGYLIERDDGSALYLRDRDRSFVRVPLNVADATTTCAPKGLALWHWPPPLQMLRSDRRADIPFCPDG